MQCALVCRVQRWELVKLLFNEQASKHIEFITIYEVIFYVEFN